MSDNGNTEMRQSRPEDCIKKRDPNRSHNSVRASDSSVKVPQWLIVAMIPLMVAASGLYVSSTSGQEARALDKEQEEVNVPRFKAIEDEQVVSKLDRAKNARLITNNASAIVQLQTSVDKGNVLQAETHDLLIIMATKQGIPIPKSEVN